MNHYEYVFCILTYRNTEDIKECLCSIKSNVSSYKVVIVNSYYDEDSKASFEEIAVRNGCDFINVPNKGYGAGNNAGIKYIKETYDYEYLIISNPDIIIEKFDMGGLPEGPKVVAPLITTIKGKNQNPYWIVKNDVAERMLYSSMKNGDKVSYITSIAMNKILREVGLLLFKISRKSSRRVYGAHGSFMILSREVINSFERLFDENMFLFAEESLLAHEFEKRGIPVILIKTVQIKHKEDGSVSLSDINENAIARESIIYYYEKINGCEVR